MKIPRLKFPTELYFEPIQLCNALCFCCPYTKLQENDDYRGVKMPREKIVRLLKGFGDLLKSHNYKGRAVVNPFRFSDPLIFKDLDVVFKYADLYNFKVRITTNAVSFNDRNEKLLNENIHNLYRPVTISIIGSTQEKVKKYMNVNLAVTLKKLTQLKKNFPKLSEYIMISMSEVESTNQEKMELENLVKKFSTIGYQTKIRKEWISNRLDSNENFHQTNKNFIKNNNKDKHVKGCNLWQNTLLRTLSVMVDGSVVLCDDDSEGKLKFGNVFSESIYKIWNTKILEYHKRIYSEKESEIKKNLICNNCSRANFNKKDVNLVNVFKNTGKFNLAKQIVNKNVNYI